MSTNIADLRLHAHFDEGAGPAIVMLHGINSDGGDWRVVIDTIGGGYRFISFDLLGFGRSPKPLDIDYSADEHALVIENTLLDLGVLEPFLLAGYSLGGDIALRYASTYPERVRRLFLLDAPFYLPPSELKEGGSGLQYAWEMGSRRLWDALGTSKRKEGFVYRLASGVGAKPLEDAFHADDIPTHWEIMSKNLTNTVNAATFVDDLPKLTMPTVFAVGVRDAIVKVSQTPALKRLKPDLEIRKLNGLAADHMTLWNMPERVAEEIMRDEARELSVSWRGGKGAPLVLLHGLQDASAAWIPAARVLARNHDVAVLDLLGHGASPAPLSSAYSLADHVAAVLGTTRTLWHEQPFVIAGDGLGATIALGCAATAPSLVSRVVAFSPALLEPGSSLGDLASGRESARAIAIREVGRSLASGARARTRRVEEAEALLVPIVRSVDNAVIATDAARLLERTRVPVRFVAPTDDDLTPTAYLAEVSQAREEFDLEVVPGRRGVPYASPDVAVRAIDPEDIEGIELAGHSEPALRDRTGSPILRATGGAESTLLRTGVLNLVAAAVVLALHPVPADLLTVGFAVWVLIASVSAIVGALGMRRQTRSARFSFVTTALPTLLAGVAGVALSSFLFADPEQGLRLFGGLVAVYAMARGAADLFVARSVEGAGRPRWLLYASGILGVVVGLSILLGPSHGRGIVRLSLAVYLAVTGVSLVAYVITLRRASERRVGELLGE